MHEHSTAQHSQQAACSKQLAASSLQQAVAAGSSRRRQPIPASWWKQLTASSSRQFATAIAHQPVVFCKSPAASQQPAITIMVAVIITHTHIYIYIYIYIYSLSLSVARRCQSTTTAVSDQMDGFFPQPPKRGSLDLRSPNWLLTPSQLEHKRYVSENWLQQYA